MEQRVKGIKEEIKLVPETSDVEVVEQALRELMQLLQDLQDGAEHGMGFS